MSQITPVHMDEERRLDQLEAEFLGGEIIERGSRLELLLLNGAEFWPGETEEIRGGKSTRMPTSGRGCCR